MSTEGTSTQTLEQGLERGGLQLRQLLGELRKVIVGQDVLLERLAIGLLTRGHVLLEGVPGLGKTLAVKTLARAVAIDFRRIQFTPDLLPADLLGTPIYNPRSGEFQTRKGPIFTNLLLADEINRAPAKVQSALLEAMEERQVTLGDETYPLDDPFLVLATQNPIEQEGTYPLPEAQLDRFLFKIQVGYPDRDRELELVKIHGKRGAMPKIEEFALEQVADIRFLTAARTAIEGVTMSDEIIAYIVDVVRATRENPSLRTGASPRAASMLCSAARSFAALAGRDYAIPDDVKMLAEPALAHRVILSPAAEIEGVAASDVIARVLEQVAAPR